MPHTTPSPRPGLPGVLDRFIGPGATRTEIQLQLASASAGAAMALVLSLANAQWPFWQCLLASFLAFDIIGGVVTNATRAAKRWYHRPGQTARNHLSFVALHLLHLVVVGWLYRDGDVPYIVVMYGLLLAGAWWILRAPAYLQRPVAMAAYLLSLSVAYYGFGLTPGLEWFTPVFFLKLFVCYLVREPSLDGEDQ